MPIGSEKFFKIRGYALASLVDNKRKTQVAYDKRRYKRRNRIEIMFGRLKNCRHVATRYDCCPKAFFLTIELAAIVIRWL
jgi:transposase